MKTDYKFYVLTLIGTPLSLFFGRGALVDRSGDSIPVYHALPGNVGDKINKYYENLAHFLLVAKV
jgi:hypothetical protein